MNRREFLTHVGATGMLTAIPAIPTMAGEWQPKTLEELDRWMRALFSENIDIVPGYDDSMPIEGFGLVNSKVIGTSPPHEHMNFVLGIETPQKPPGHGCAVRSDHEPTLCRIAHQYVKQTLIDNPRLIGGRAFWRAFPQIGNREFSTIESGPVDMSTIRFRLTVIEA